MGLGIHLALSPNPLYWVKLWVKLGEKEGGMAFLLKKGTGCVAFRCENLHGFEKSSVSSFRRDVVLFLFLRVPFSFP